MYKTVLISLAAAAWLVGCGSSGSSTTTTSPEETPTTSVTGYLVDSAVMGVTYSCGDVNGTTDVNGTFECETLPVSFSIGGLDLGTISGLPSDEHIYPQDLVGAERDDFNDTNVVKMAVLLQSLDSDGNVSNGIDINASVTQAFEENGPLSFDDITDLNETLQTVAGVEPISEEDAVSNLEDYYYEENGDNASPLVGAWAMSDESGTYPYAGLVIVVDNSHYFYTQELLGAEGIIGGVEVGTFTLNADENNLTNATPVINTNAGDTATDGYLTYDASDDTATFTESATGDQSTVHRVSATTDHPEAGAWISWEDSEHFTTIVMNGSKYMFSGVNLTEDNYNLNDDDGRDNATEFGSYTLGSDGTFSATPDAATDFSVTCTDADTSGCDTAAGDSDGTYGFNGITNVKVTFPDTDHMAVTFTETATATAQSVTFVRIYQNGPQAAQ